MCYQKLLDCKTFFLFIGKLKFFVSSIKSTPLQQTAISKHQKVKEKLTDESCDTTAAHFGHVVERGDIFPSLATRGVSPHRVDDQLRSATLLALC